MQIHQDLKKESSFIVTILSHNTVTCRSDYRRGFGLSNRFIGCSQVVTTISTYTLQITVIITHK
jgi:hypothetical protein